MFISILTAIACVLAIPVAVAEEGAPAAPAVDGRQVGYFYGYNFGTMLKQQTDMPVDLDELRRGIEDALAGRDAALSREQQQQIMGLIQSRQEEMQQQQLRATENSARAWLAENAAREGVQSTASGLQYQVLTAASGARPGPDDQVSVNYRGQTVDGREFDSSYQRGEPAEFGLNQVIDGWTEGLQLMSPGARYRFFIPPQLAYGVGGVPRAGIPPNAVLIFEVELLEIKGATP